MPGRWRCFLGSPVWRVTSRRRPMLVLAFGIWLVDLGGRSFGEAWIAGALTLFALALVLGALGGRRPRKARLLAGRLGRDAAAVNHELRGGWRSLRPLLRTTPPFSASSRSSLSWLASELAATFKLSCSRRRSRKDPAQLGG
jgi:hypothetical protein